MENTIFSAIIPHAGKLYAGQARKKVFDYILKKPVKIEYVIYIASIHNIVKELSSEIYSLYQDFDIGYTFKKYPPSGHEHSYEWVKNELNDAFPESKKLVIGPTQSYDKYINLSKKLSNFILNSKKGVLLLGTTDLIHYGEKFENVGQIEYPERETKSHLEENLILDMIQSSYSKIKDRSENISLMCGPYAIQLFLYINSLLYNSSKKNVFGNVLDYYDSSVYDKKGIDKYVIYPSSTKEFVSYVSILYDPSVKKNKNGIDNIMALAFVKSILIRNLFRKNYSLNLEKWHSFHYRKNGVFVGTSLNGHVNSCYGHFENHTSLADNIIYAANMCIQDSIERWNNPITVKNINNHRIKIDILDEKKDWKKIQSSDFLKEFVVDGTYGVHLTLRNGGSATYLPSVAYEYRDKWSSYEYITNLTQKAGGNGDEWKFSKIQLYKTTIIES